MLINASSEILVILRLGIGKYFLTCLKFKLDTNNYFFYQFLSSIIYMSRIGIFVLSLKSRFF